MTMKPEPLKGKEQVIQISNNPRTGILKYYTPHSVRLAVGWYRRWAWLPVEFYNKNPKYRKELDKLFSKIILWRVTIRNRINDVEYTLILTVYNDWLFKKAFEDVIKK